MRKAELKANQRTRPRTVLRLMQELHEKGKLESCWRERPDLIIAACECFGSWNDALRHLDDHRNRNDIWSKERVVEALIRWDEANHTNPGDRKPAPYQLRRVARKYFGSFHDALDTLNLNDPYRWTRKTIIEAIQNRYINGLPINEREDRGLYCVARKKFGTWRNAVQAAGLAEKPRITKRRWTKDLIIFELKEWSKGGRCLSLVRKENYPLFMASKKHFGTWRKAVAAAGLKMMLGKQNTKNTGDA